MEENNVMYNGNPISAEALRETGFLYMNLANAMDREVKQRSQYLESPDDPKEHAEAIAARERVRLCTEELQNNYAVRNAPLDAENARLAAARKQHLRLSNLLYAAAGALVTFVAMLVIL